MLLDAMAVKLDPPGPIRDAATDLTRATDRVAEHAAQIRSGWMVLAHHYRAPEQPEVLAGMDPPHHAATALAESTHTIGHALHTYADALERLHAQQDLLAADIAAYRTDLATHHARHRGCCGRG